jgi:hypothetical protein
MLAGCARDDSKEFRWFFEGSSKEFPMDQPAVPLRRGWSRGSDIGRLASAKRFDLGGSARMIAIRRLLNRS